MRRLGEGREAEIFEWHDGTVLRLFRSEARSHIDAEETALRAAGRGPVLVPALYGRETVDGRPGLVMERIDGEDQLTILARRPWRLIGVARGLGRTHAALNAMHAPPEVEPLRTRLHRRIASVETLPTRLRDRALAVLDDLPDDDRLLHGDLHPGNVLVSSRGPVVIDWTCTTRGDPDADVARTTLMLRLGALPPGTRTLLRVLDRAGRGVFLRLYLNSYRHVRRFDPPSVERWLVPHAAARLAEGIDEEIDALLAFLRDRLGAV